MKNRTILNLVCALCCLSLFQQAPDARAQSSSQRINGTAVGIGGRLGGRSRQFTLIANNYTAPNQVRELNDALRRGGDEELLRTLSGMDAGRIQIGTGVGVKANAIIADSWGEGGSKLTVFYERNINFLRTALWLPVSGLSHRVCGDLSRAQWEGARDINPGGTR
jgi:hypothetical protein